MKTHFQNSILKGLILGCTLLLALPTTISAQVTTKIDTTAIKIGEQIKYEISVEADSTKLVVFPEGQSFMPLELVEASDIDSVRNNEKYRLLRTYFLTQFDSGRYTIPRQKVIIADNPFFTDSLEVFVNTVQVDTTKQGLYDIKPLLEVEESRNSYWLMWLLILIGVGVVAFLLYWFIWRKKPLTKEEKIALLPPYDRAKLALKDLEQSQYLIRSEVKTFYSELSLIIRKYLDEKVYDRALESTTDELISRLELLKDGNQIPLKKDSIKNLEVVLKRADLVKFAKSKPDMALAELDQKTIQKELEEVKTVLPEPSEEEKLLDEQYRKVQAERKKRKKIIMTVGISLFLLVATIVGFGIKYGFKYVKDTVIGLESKELLEGEWVTSAYGFPPIYIETPEVLKREVYEVPEELKDKVDVALFKFVSESSEMNIELSTTKFTLTEEEKAAAKDEEAKANELLAVSENIIKGFENDGAKDITVKRDQFITPNAAEGLKTFGTMNVEIEGESYSAEYVILLFKAENVRQQILLVWKDNEVYIEDIMERVINSIELNPTEESQE